MKCDKCGCPSYEDEITEGYTIIDGKWVNFHLCSLCLHKLPFFKEPESNEPRKEGE